MNHACSMALGGIACALVLFAPVAEAQTFQTVYDGNTEIGHDIVATNDCGFQVIGRASPTGTGRAFISRLTSTGKVAWANVYHPAAVASSFGYSIAQSHINDDFILGCDFGAAAGVGTRYVIRTDNSGSPLWGTRLSGDFSTVTLGQGGSYGFVPVSVTELDNANIAVSSRLVNSNSVARVGLLALLQSDGSLDFSKRYVPGGGSTAAVDFVQVREARDPNPTKQLLVLGTILFSTDFYGVFAMRTDAGGNILWARTYLHPDGISNLIGGGFDLASNGDILFSAVRESKPLTPSSNRNGVVGRIDAITGDPIWASTFDGFRTGFGSVSVDSAGHMLTAGFIGNGFDTAGAVVRFDSTGAFMDGKSYGDQLVNARGASDAIIPLPNSSGYAVYGRTQEVAPNAWASLLRTDTDLTTGCHERKFSPEVVPLEVVVRTPSLTVLTDAAFKSEMPVVERLDTNAIYRCITEACTGDLNADGFVDDADFVLFADAYNELLCPTDPVSGCCPADFNGDGFVDDADFVLFATAYDQLTCP